MAGPADYLRLVRFSHTLFAMPFALIALLTASDGAPGARTLLLVLAALVAARTSAMAFNRYVDRDIDAANPRTRNREIPSGVLRPTAVLALTIGSAAAFVAVAFALGPLCGILSMPVLAVLLGYSLAKRFTSLCHLWLGVALGLAPPAAWVAVRGVVDASLWAPLCLGLGVTAWVHGFDLLYACQDEAFDRRAGLHSIPARYGRAVALRFAAISHVVAAVAFAGYGVLAHLAWPYAAGVIAAVLLLLHEHRLVRADADLARIQIAFFRMNALVSVVLLVATTFAVYGVH